jgi:hypothetical protein
MSISLAQVIICMIVLLTENSPINQSTVIMAIIYLLASSSTNPFEVTNDLVSLMKQNYDRKFRPSLAMRILYWSIAVPLSPLFVIPLCVTATLDMVVGKINNISYGEMVNIMVNFIVIFTGFSVGLRSGNAVNAVQTFAGKYFASSILHIIIVAETGFQFIGELDEAILMTFEIDMNALTSHKHGAGERFLIPSQPQYLNPTTLQANSVKY